MAQGGIANDYAINLRFGDIPASIDMNLVKEWHITQSVDNLSPVFKMVFSDNDGKYTHLMAPDKTLNRLSMDVTDRVSNETNTFSFKVIRRSADSFNNYTISGIADLPELFNDQSPTAYTGKIKDSIESIAERLQIISNVGASLNYEKTLINAGWSLASFLNHIKDKLCGNQGQKDYLCFIRNTVGGLELVFNSFDELAAQNVSHKYIIGQAGIQDVAPAYEWQVYDDSNVFNEFSYYGRTYGYFDYENSEFVRNTVTAENFYNLGERIFVDKDDMVSRLTNTNKGRSNDFTSDFSEETQNRMCKSMNESARMWLVVNGDATLYPAQIIDVVFPQAFTSGQLFDYQHQGFWIIDRVVHIFGKSFITKILCSRNGINTSTDTTLAKATNRKK